MRLPCGVLIWATTLWLLGSHFGSTFRTFLDASRRCPVRSSTSNHTTRIHHLTSIRAYVSQHNRDSPSNFPSREEEGTSNNSATEFKTLDFLCPPAIVPPHRGSKFWIPTTSPTRTARKQIGSTSPNGTIEDLLSSAGLIRKVARGIYAYMPLGQRVLRKLCHIIRVALTSNGLGFQPSSPPDDCSSVPTTGVSALTDSSCSFQEVCLPALQPSSLWQESGRAKTFARTFFRILGVNEIESPPLVLSPTSEELAVSLLGFKPIDLPMGIFQIAPKFRNEARPSKGLSRSKEFWMMEAYSFHKTAESLELTYTEMEETLLKVLRLLGLTSCSRKVKDKQMLPTVTPPVENSTLPPLHGGTAPAEEVQGAVTEYISHEIHARPHGGGRSDQPSAGDVGDTIEVGHIFKLQKAYTSFSKHSWTRTLHMGSYGIGVSRLFNLAAAIQPSPESSMEATYSYDQAQPGHKKVGGRTSGLTWASDLIAPFTVVIIPLSKINNRAERSAGRSNPAVYWEEQVCSYLYTSFQQAGIDAMWDDRRQVSSAAKFVDASLLGIPHWIIVGEPAWNPSSSKLPSFNTVLANGRVEYKILRKTKQDNVLLPIRGVVKEVQQRIV